MTKQEFLTRLDYLGMVHGVTLRAIGLFSDEDLAFRPSPNVRSPRELIFHIYSQERNLAEGAKEGRLTLEAATAPNPETSPGAEACAALATVSDARAYAAASHGIADKIFRSLSDEDLARPVESPFGTFPAAQFFAFAYDEHWHHRGQLYTYLRLLGKEPPMLYDYEGNA